MPATNQSFRFFLGVHHPGWLERTDVPLFISRRRLANRKRLPRALGTWALDSGGFTELSLHGRWTITPEAYAEEVRRFAREIGNLDWAAIQDWMCEPWILKKTGKTIAEHQELTLANYLRLNELAPEIKWAPVLQGWTPADYRRHVAMYEDAGVDLAACPVIGMGSVCRRQSTLSIGLLIQELAEFRGLRLHVFGFKTKGLPMVINSVVSSDSMAWSLEAGFHRHEGADQNCLGDALEWRDAMLNRVAREAQERGVSVRVA